MKDKLLDILVCPECKGELKLTISERIKGEIITGSLFCTKCNVDYPVKGGIPNLLPQENK